MARHGEDVDPFVPGSVASEVLELLASRWTILILSALDDGPMRFTALRERTGMGPQVLTRTLRRAEEGGLVTREVFAEVPPRVEYRFTDLGRTLCPLVHLIRDWATEHASEVTAAQTRARRQQRRHAK